MKKLLSALLVLFMLQTQSFARANVNTLDTSFARVASEIGEGKLSSAQIMEKAKAIAVDAKSAGVSETEFVAHFSKKMALNMSEDDVKKSVEELKGNHSSERMNELADALAKNNSQDKVLMVLLTFALMSALLIGIFFAIADPTYPR